MNKLSKDFFAQGEILYWDQLNKGIFCPCCKKKVNKTMGSNGVKVVVLKASVNGKVADLNSLENVPGTAFILYNREDEQSIISQLFQRNIKRILFHPLNVPSKEALDQCKKQGVETFIGCPMMVLGKGFCKVHSYIL